MSGKCTLFFYELKLAIHSMTRHLVLSLSAMAAMMISLLLCTVLIGLELHVESFISNAAQRMNLHAVLESTLSEAQEKEVAKALQAVEGVQSIEFSDKDHELEMLIQEKGEAFAMYRGEDNPLSDAYFVFPQDGAELAELADRIEEIDGVLTVAYGGQSAQDFLDLLSRIRLVSWSIVALLLILSLYLIYNAVKTAIESRAQEIAIMKQVGADNSFIRIPFIMEGIFLALGGALFPFLLVLAGYPALYELLGGRLFVNVFALIPPASLRTALSLFLFAAAFFLGLTASTMAVNRYLKETR